MKLSGTNRLASNHRSTAVVLVAMLVISLLLGRPLSATAQTVDDYAALDLLADILFLVQQNHVDAHKLDQLVDGAVRGLLTSLDPHSEYMNADEFSEALIDTEGSFNGLGIEISVKDDSIIIIAPIDGTPAQRAGIRPGDRISAIDGLATSQMGIHQALQKLRGPIGSVVRLQLQRDQQSAPLDLELRREKIELTSVQGRLLPATPGGPAAIGYLRISQFQKNTAAQLLPELQRLRQQAGNQWLGLILDVRNNPGGLLDQAVAITDLFLDGGLVVSTRGRRPQDELQFTAEKTATEPDYPVVVLINEGSASASEILAGALQDHRRALIVGVTSFGKGSVQALIPLSNGGGLRLTTAYYYTPNGHCLQARGIIPDLVVPQGQWQTSAAGPPVREADLPQPTAVRPAELYPQITTSDPADTELLRQDFQLFSAINLLIGCQRLTGETPSRATGGQP